jgi:hypothetical protein
MARQSMGKTMSNSTCDWVRARMPLWVGDCDVRSEPTVEEGDLIAADRLTIERHLEDCANCRQYRVALDQAMGALAIAAAHLPVDTQAPSIWPALKHRIADQTNRGSAHWVRTTRRLADPWNRRKLAFALGTGLTASLLVAVIGYPILHSQLLDAQSTIDANAAPLADDAVAPLPPDEELVQNPEPDETVDTGAGQVAQTEPALAPEGPVSALDATSTPKQPPPRQRRFGYDLEHGTPMPPDSRELKPVY